MVEPTLDALRVAEETLDPSGVEQRGLGHRIAVAAGVACISGYIGYGLVRSQQASVSQALWSRDEGNQSPTPTDVRPRLALVNMSETLRLRALAGLRAWLDVEAEVEVVCPTVTLVEEEEASAISALATEARRAALCAWAELTERNETNGSSVSKPLCCIVYRTITEVDGQALDDWDVQKVKLSGWHGKRFVTRHCVGVSVDGRQAMVLMHDIEGIVDVGPLHVLDDARFSDCGSLVRRYGAPCASSFHGWRLSAGAHHSSATGRLPFKLLSGRESHLPCGQRCQLWQSPLHIFAALGAVLRYSRTDAAVYPDHIVTPLSMPPNVNPEAICWWRRVQRTARRCAAPLLRRYTARRRERMERQRQLSSTFVVVINLAENSASVTSGMLRVVEEHAAEWILDMSRASSTEIPLLNSNRVCVKDTAAGAENRELSPVILVDLTDIVCSVIAAECLLIRLVSLFAALGVSPALARLVAVPGTQAGASLLCPTPSSPNRCTPALCTAQPGPATPIGRFLTLAAPNLEEAAFVVSEHDFSRF
ncbi:hypothetical protein LSCM1_02494 [Leishmania martiniquensis]|uniref:Uncharacterized protein n=1 Tax=Leishmania martiniquensis TaxID=1580590 RepID=A0A836KAH1_9TRYP|nr:hypothetical protein LSCM1_02494 [Leishmania martiniquensis]